MRSLVVLFAVIAAAFAAPQYLVQPPNTPAIVLDPLGRPLDTAEVASARALHYQAKALEGHVLKKRSVGHAVAYSVPAVYSVPAAVSHQSRVDVRTSPAVVATNVVSAPVVAEPVVEARAVYAAPTVKYVGGSAVSHQSRVDVRTSPAVVATAPVVSAPVVSAPAVVAEPAVVEARAVYAPAATFYSGGSAVTHQSRVDVHSSPAVVQHVVSPAVVEARSVWAPSVYSTW